MRNLSEKISHSIYKIKDQARGESCLKNFDLFFLLTKMTYLQRNMWHMNCNQNTVFGVCNRPMHRVMAATTQVNLREFRRSLHLGKLYAEKSINYICTKGKDF